MPTESQLRDTALRLHIGELIDNRRLLVMLPDRISAGYGSGDMCAACDQPITGTQVEYDVDHPRDTQRRLTFHMGCHVVWQLECALRVESGRADAAAWVEEPGQ